MPKASRKTKLGAYGLALLHARFVGEYLKDLDATQAARRAGYSEKSAHVLGPRLLTRPDIQQAVALAARQQLDKVELSSTRTLEELRRVAFSSLQNVFDDGGNLRPLAQLSPDVASAIQSVEVIKRNLTSGDGQTDVIYKVKSWDKMRALELLCRYFGLDTQQIQVSGGVDVRWMTDADTPAASSKALPDVTVSAIPHIPESTDSGQ